MRKLSYYKGVIMEFKWFAIMMAIFAIAMVISDVFDGNRGAVVDTAAMNAGLEQCPIEPGSIRKIWVKDCIKYLESYKKDEK